MAEGRYDHLIQAGIDDELSPAERDGLEEVLAASTNARALHDDLRRLSDALGTLPALEPPPEIRETVLESVVRPVETSPSRRAAIWPVAVGYVAAFAAGLLLMSALFEVGLDEGPAWDVTELTGTMVERGTLPEVEAMASLSLASDIVTGRVELYGRDEVFALEFELDSESQVEAVVHYGESGLGFGGFSQIDTELIDIQVTDGRVRLVSEGHQRFTVFLRSGPEAEVSIDLSFQAGELIQEETIRATE